MVRIGTVLLIAAIALLGVAAEHRIVSPEAPRVLSDRAAFARFAADRPGRFLRIHVHRGGVDRVCARHVKPRYRLCGTVRRQPDGARKFVPRPAGARRSARRELLSHARRARRSAPLAASGAVA
jgi:hypothetical protein